MAVDASARLAELEVLALTAVAALEPEALAGARWSGLGGRSVRSVELVDVFGLGAGGAVAVVEATSVDPAGVETAVRLTLPLDEAAAGVGLHALASRGGIAVGARGGRLVGRPGPGGGSASPGSAVGAATSDRPPLSVRPARGDQSHTSVVLDERSILKLYRRLTPGPNPEAEVLGVLAGVAGAPVPAWVGAVDLVLATGETTTLAIEQAFVDGATDAFEVHAEGLAGWLAGQGDAAPTTTAAATGFAIGRLHAALASIEERGFGSRLAGPSDRAGWLTAAESRLGAAVGAVRAVDPELADRIAGYGHAIRRALRPLGDPAIPVRLQRIHGDLHLGQVLPTPDDGVLLVDFEGDPMLPPADRRGLGAPLVDLAGFLRSIDHAARSGLRRAGSRLGGGPEPAASAALDRWIESARAACLGGYAAGLGQPGWTPNRALLRAFEVDKELREFVYAATFLPGWLYAPAGGLPALLGEILPPGPPPGSPGSGSPGSAGPRGSSAG